MAQPPGFVDNSYHSHVCKLCKAIYGLKQAPSAWYNELLKFLLTFSFVNTQFDTSLFIYSHGHITIILLVFVDDIIVTGSSSSAIT